MITDGLNEKNIFNVSNHAKDGSGFVGFRSFASHDRGTKSIGLKNQRARSR
jgi:hypothetical protein